MGLSSATSVGAAAPATILSVAFDAWAGFARWASAGVAIATSSTPSRERRTKDFVMICSFLWLRFSAPPRGRSTSIWKVHSSALQVGAIVTLKPAPCFLCAIFFRPRKEPKWGPFGAADLRTRGVPLRDSRGRLSLRGMGRNSRCSAALEGSQPRALVAPGSSLMTYCSRVCNWWRYFSISS